MLKEKNDLSNEIRNAQKLHGHLGPFLVIGVRIGITARTVSEIDTAESGRFRVTAQLPLETPFSCVIDGIQATTQCTIGNQKLKTRNSKTEIVAYFEQQDSKNALKIRVNPEVIEYLKNRFSQDASNEELASEIASMPRDTLFIIEK